MFDQYVFVEIVGVLALIQYLGFGFLTGSARRDSGLKAPATIGHEGFERMYRVQMNTMETLIVFLPALFLAGKYWPAWLVAGLGVIYLIGRFLYWKSYIKSPNARGTGFMLSMLPTFALVILALVGMVKVLVV